MFQPFSIMKQRSAYTNLRTKKEFPIQISDNPDEFETINHPGYAMSSPSKNVPLEVPKFWEPKNGRESLGEDLMSPSVARSVGSKIILNESGIDKQVETIFLSVASYRDYQCASTVANAFERAKHPQRIRVAVIDQIIEKVDTPCTLTVQQCQENPQQTLCKYSEQIDSFQLDAPLAVGPVFARHLGHRMYRGEYFAMQVDAHVSFVQDWDHDIVTQWKSANNEMAVLTVYLSDVQGSIDEKTGKSLNLERPIMCNSDFIPYFKDLALLKHNQQPQGPPGIHGTPTLEPYWAAGFSFSRGHFVVNVPYDQHLPMIFQGEEISIGLRAFTYGYDFYTPERSVCFHMYAFGKNESKRKKVSLFSENESKYIGVRKKSLVRLLGIIDMFHDDNSYDWYQEDKRKYGIGRVRTLDKFFKTYGIHVKEKRVEHHLCSFVGKKMQNKFIPYLRSDGMGIDYDKINFEFVDPQPDREQLFH